MISNKHALSSALDAKTILVTGGTGSFGKKFVAQTLSSFNPKRIIVYSRDEMKQWSMKSQYDGENRIAFRIGDIRDRQQLADCLKNVDIVIHAAATKIVPTAELNPFECVKTNVFGSMNVVEACKHAGVKCVIALSTDKACNPINLYGATKLTADKLFTVGDHLSESETKFAVVRYGNVMGSRGSVIPFFLKLAAEGKPFPITDPAMTRFMISLEDAVDTVWLAIQEMEGGEIFVRKAPSMGIVSIAKAINPNAEMYDIGIRAGEKMHEKMIVEDDAPTTFEHKSYYVVLPDRSRIESYLERNINASPVEPDFCYSSDKNGNWMTIDDLAHFLKFNKSTLESV